MTGRGPTWPSKTRDSLELVVLGKVKLLAETDSPRTFEVEVEKILYGSTADKTIRFTSYWKQDGQRFILALMPDLNAGEPYQLRYRLDAAEERGAPRTGRGALRLQRPRL